MSNLFYVNQLENDSLTWRLYVHNVNSSGDDDNPKYENKYLVDVGILQDTEATIGVGHSYNEGMSDPLGGMLKDLHSKGRQFSYLTNNLGNANSMVKKISATAGSFMSALGSDEFGDTIKNAGDSADNFLKGIIDKADSGFKDAFGASLTGVLNSEFISAFDLVRTWTGSKATFSIPKLETTWISGLAIRKLDKNIKERFNKVINVVMGRTTNALNLDLYGLQMAPNDYKPEFTGINPKNPFKGTFSLAVGKKYLIENLTLDNFQCTASNLTCMGTDDPLYATVSYELSPGSFITRAQLKALMKGSGNVKGVAEVLKGKDEQG